MFNKKIKLLFLSLFLIGLFVVGAHIVLAQNAPSTASEINKQLQAAAGSGGANFGKVQDPRLTVALIIRFALSLLGTIALVLVVYAGFLWMTAGGNEEQVTKSKTLLFQAVIGLAIILMSYGIVLLATRIVMGQYYLDSGWQVLPPAYVPGNPNYGVGGP